MTDVRRLHTVAAAINGVALAAALLGRSGVAAAACALSGLLLIWSADRLRFHLVTREDRSHG